MSHDRDSFSHHHSQQASAGQHEADNPQWHPITRHLHKTVRYSESDEDPSKYDVGAVSVTGQKNIDHRRIKERGLLKQMVVVLRL